jgi:hypothetical protein
MGAEHVQRAIGQIPSHHAPTGAGGVHDQIQVDNHVPGHRRGARLIFAALRLMFNKH